MPAQIGIRLINSTAYAFTYVTGIANTGAKDTSTPVPTSLPSEVYLSTTSGAAANGTMFTGYVLFLSISPRRPNRRVQAAEVSSALQCLFGSHQNCQDGHGMGWPPCVQGQCRHLEDYTVALHSVIGANVVAT